MPKFLNHLDLNGNQLKNTKLEITDSPLAEEGVIHYHDTSNTVRYHDGNNFITLGDSDVVSTAGAGLAPILPSSHGGKFLKADGTYAVPAYIANTNTQNTTTLSFVDSSDDIVIRNTTGGAGSGTDDIKIVAGSNITLTHTDADNFTIAATDTNTQLSTTGVTGMALTGMVTSSTADVAATDSILVAIGKLEARTALNDDKVTNSQVSTDVTLATVSNNYLSISGQAITAGTVPVALGGTGATTASAARTNLDVDQSGTDNSTPVTLVTTSHDYLSLSGQAITLAAIDLTADVTGDLPISEGGTGQSTASAAFGALKQAATTSATGVVELAAASEVKDGSGAGKVVDASQIGARSAVATIDVSNATFASNLYAEINHGLGTEDVIVQLFDSSTKETVYADIARTDKSNSASTSKIKITFASAPSADIEVIVTSTKGASAGVVAYS